MSSSDRAPTSRDVDARDDRIVEIDYGLGEVERVLFGRAASARGSGLGRYIQLEKLGQGGNGVVYAAYDPELRRKVALKLLRSKRRRGGSIPEERLVREARALSQVSHPHVVPIYDIGRIADPDGQRGVFLVMKLVEGQQFDRWLADGTRRWTEICDVLVQAGRGLAAAHELGIVHRDFKPANLLVESDEAGPRATVLDFGLAFGLGASAHDTEDGSGDESYDERLTAAGLTVGTPLYMSPEQHLSDELDPRSDQYSLCAVLYEALFGRLPWAGLSLRELGASKHQPISVPRVRGIPAGLGGVVRRGLRPSPEDRFPSMNALLDALEAVPRRRRRRWIAASLAGAVTIPSVGWWLHQRHVAQDCRAQGQRATASFSDAVDEQLRGRFVDLAPFGEQAYGWVSGELRGYRDRLSDSFVDSCEATRLRGKQTPRIRSRRDACLEHRVDALAVVVESLEGADAAAAVALPRLVASLPSIDACEDEESLVRDHAPWIGEHPEIERRRKAADARAVLRPRGDAAAALESLVAEAEATGDRALLARMRLSQGIALGSKNDFDEARVVLEQAILDAESVGDHETVTRALQALAEAYQPKDAVRFEQLLEQADARQGHRPLGAVFEARLWLSFAHVHLLTDRLDEALDAATSAHDALVRYLGPEHPYVATALEWQARILHAQAELDEARDRYRAAAELREGALGRTHPLVMRVLENWGLLEMEAGDHEASVRVLQRLVDAQTERVGADSPAALWARAALGGATMRAGDVEAGEALLESALAGLDRTSRAGGIGQAELLFHAAGWLDAAGRTERALELARRSVEILEAVVEADHPTLARARRHLAELQASD